MTHSVVILMVVCNGLAAGQVAGSGVSVAGQDLHVAAPVMTTCSDPMPGWSHAILLDEGVSVQIGDNLLSSRSAVIWLQPQGTEQAAYGEGKAYLARLYLEGSVTAQKGPKSRTTAVQHFMVEGAEVLLTQFLVTGEVFASSDSQNEVTSEFLQEHEVYSRAIRASRQISYGPSIPASAMVPSVAEVVVRPADKPSTKPQKPSDTAIAQQLNEATSPETEEEAAQAEPEFPVHISALWEPAPQIQRAVMPDGQEVYTASGRFYIWQKRTDGQVMEFMADEMVLFTQPGNFSVEQQQSNQIGSGKIRSAYLSGNIVMTEFGRTVRCDEVYYDFVRKRALAVNASMRMFDPERGVPIYLRAQKMGRVSEDIFEAKDVVLTSSEFYMPQLSFNTSKLVMLSGEALEQHHRLTEKKKDDVSDLEIHMIDVDAKYKDRTFFSWPKMVTDLQRPLPALKKLTFGNDTENGTSIETRWHMAKLLGYKEPEWLETELLMDYFSKRGPGVGVNAEWETEEARGGLIGYVMHDTGEDRLSRNRKDIAPDQEVRGRFSFRHRQYLPEDWQLTLEASYISDRTFLESMYRTEFYNDKGQETLVYLKRLKDNWAFSILTKIRINDFETVTEELPSIEYHLAGQSFWDHRFTFYSDNQVARFRNKFDEDAILGPQATSDYYTFAWTRNEVDLPLMLNTIKLVPFVAGSASYEDNYGYQKDLNNNQILSEEQVYFGELGLRASTMFWKEDPYVRSSMWDLNGMRHIITPYAAAVLYEGSDEVIDQRNTVHLGISQRWQTHRGSEENQRQLDWMRLDLSGTWVDNDADSSESPLATNPLVLTPGNVTTGGLDINNSQLYGPAAFVYNDPSIPFLQRRNRSYYGIARDTFNGEYVWRVSDTFSLLSDVNYDIDDGRIQQFDIGVSRYVHPDISYYVGTRYLRPILIPVDEDDDGVLDDYQEGSNAFVGAVTYRFSPRYTATFSQEYNFEYGEMIRSDLSFVRQYHRLFFAMSVSFDEALDTSSVVFSIWPQGVKELAIGSREHVGLTGKRWED
ncbi:MAG: LPS assembly protein LptD [Planctomycetota bacterium]